ncbi:N-acetylglucosamine-6-phosphate deacetylase [Alteribacter aurantiacus]|uniref:N-acetylglucosamine-6-phosphate deacetylase n=1 Tax=Alteribacter aurantiacus TaxID=254410 RepID=UPI00040F3713|nr:N-acetylglucosamine-6-phosphate deacetylase [Alteribacter aurantiacus]
MKTYYYPGCELYHDKGVMMDPAITIDEKAIINLEDGKKANSINATTVYYPPGTKIVPGFIDLHIHGTHKADVMDAKDWTLPTMARHLPEEGTTSFLATTITQDDHAKIAALEGVAKYMKKPIDGAEVLGVHLEGPFISKQRAGAQPIDHIKKPSIPLFQTFQKAASGNIKLATIAPEEGMELVSYLANHNVIPSIGHSDAYYSDVKEAISFGLTHATHLFNGMRGVHHRDLGVAGGVLLHEEVIAELIVDGIHMSPEMVKLTFKNKGPDQVILITDAMRAKGLPDGVFDLGGQEVTVKGGRAELSDGTLAGSVIKMNEAIKNMIAFSGCTFKEAINMATINPAKQLGVDNRKGSIALGKDADYTVLSPQCQVLETFCQGTKVYSLSEGGPS